jgi:glycosyltransferase involved in cell wall biosynthesis
MNRRLNDVATRPAGGSTATRGAVLHVIPYLWSGAGGVVTRLCEAQRERGPVAIVTGGRRGEHPDWPAYRARLRRAGVEHHRIDFFQRDSATFWSSVNELRALVRAVRPAVIHAHAGVPAAAAAIARTDAPPAARLIGQMYSWGPNRPEWMNQQDAAGFSHCDRVVLSARAYEPALVDRGVPADKLTYLPWGLPLESFVPRAPRFGSDAPQLGFVGRIEPRKGQLELVNVFARVIRRFPQARLTLVGPVADAAYGEEVRALIARRGLGRSVRLAGEARSVERHVRSWDLFVSMSSDEGQGLAVLEAMALGVPVVARSVAGINDFLVDGRTGVTIDGASTAAAAAVLVRALERPATISAISRAARRMVEQRYSWQRTLSAFERLYWSRASAALCA